MAYLTSGYVLRKIEAVYDSILLVRFLKYSASKKLLMIEMSHAYCVRLIRAFDHNNHEERSLYYSLSYKTKAARDLNYHEMKYKQKIKNLLLDEM